MIFFADIDPDLNYLSQTNKNVIISQYMSFAMNTRDIIYI